MKFAPIKTGKSIMSIVRHRKSVKDIKDYSLVFKWKPALVNTGFVIE
jgi:hypothetical protein